MIDGLRKLSWHIYDHDALPDGMGWQQLADTIAEAAGLLEGMQEDLEGARRDAADAIEALEIDLAESESRVEYLRAELAEQREPMPALLRRAYAVLCELAQVADVRQHMASVGEAYLIDHIQEAIK